MIANKYAFASKKNHGQLQLILIILLPIVIARGTRTRHIVSSPSLPPLQLLVSKNPSTPTATNADAAAASRWMSSSRSLRCCRRSRWGAGL